MRQELETPNPSQKFPDRLSGDHASVLFTAEERREIILDIAKAAFVLSGYPLRETEYSSVAKVWSEKLDAIPDGDLETVRKRGFEANMTLPEEYSEIYDSMKRREAIGRNTQALLAQYAAKGATAVKPDEMTPGKKYAFDMFDKWGIG